MAPGILKKTKQVCRKLIRINVVFIWGFFLS